MQKYDPAEPTMECHISAWDAEVIARILQTPAAAVYGTDNNLRMIALIAKVDHVRGHFVQAGAYQKQEGVTGQPPPSPPTEPPDQEKQPPKKKVERSTVAPKKKGK